MTSFLAARDVSVFYGKMAAVRGVSLQIDAGQVVTIVGANGAGKTTLLAALMGLQRLTGEVVYFGKPHARQPMAEALVSDGLALIPEKRELFGAMSVAENLALGAFSRWRRGLRDSAATLAEVYALFPRLAERQAQAAATLSGGERQMLAMGRALMGRPRLLMLDEPSLGLAPLVTRDIFRIIGVLRDRGVAILLVEQNARAALAIADYGYVMEAGAFVLEGRAEQLAQHERVIEAYLGVAVTQKDRAVGALD